MEKNVSMTSSTNMHLLAWNPTSVGAGTKITKTLRIPLSGKSPPSIPHEPLRWYGAKNAFLGSGICELYAVDLCWDERENGRDYGQLKPTLCRSAGVTESGQECSPRLILSMRTNSAASTYARWIINANMAQLKTRLLVRESRNGWRLNDKILLRGNQETFFSFSALLWISRMKSFSL